MTGPRDVACPPHTHSWLRRGQGDKYFMYFNFLIDGFDVLSHFLFYFPTSKVLEGTTLFPTKSSRFPFCDFSSKPLGQRCHHRDRFLGRPCLPQPPGTAGVLHRNSCDTCNGFISRKAGDPGQPMGQLQGKSEAGKSQRPSSKVAQRRVPLTHGESALLFY